MLPITQCLLDVPQGLVLGPILFPQYIATIWRIINNYADHTTLYTILDRSNELPIGNLNKYTEVVEYCFLLNDTQLKTSKIDVVPIGTRQQLVKTIHHQLSIADTEVHLSEELKILEVVINETLTFGNHVAQLCC